MMKSTSESYIKVAIQQRVAPPKPPTMEQRVQYGSKAYDSPITWWPFDDAILESMARRLLVCLKAFGSNGLFL